MLVTMAGLSFLAYDTFKPINIQIEQIQSTKPDDVLSSTELLRLINANRKLEGLNELNVDTRLNTIAQYRLDDMVANQYYSHQNLEGKYYYDFFRYKI